MGNNQLGCPFTFKILRRARHAYCASRRELHRHGSMTCGCSGAARKGTEHPPRIHQWQLVLALLRSCVDHHHCRAYWTLDPSYFLVRSKVTSRLSRLQLSFVDLPIISASYVPYCPLSHIITLSQSYETLIGHSPSSLVVSLHPKISLKQSPHRLLCLPAPQPTGPAVGEILPPTALLTQRYYKPQR